MSVATIYIEKSAQGTSAANGSPGNTGNVSGVHGASLWSGIFASCSGVQYYNIALAADVSSLAGKAITAASFFYWIIANMSESNSFYAYLATTSWSEIDASLGPFYDLNDHTADMVSSGTGAYIQNSDTKWKEWIQKWTDGTIPNNGWVLDWTGSASSYVQMYTEDQTGTANDPYLSITYYDKPVMTPTGGSVPLAGNVPVAYSISIPSGGALAQVAVRRKRLTGA